MRSTGAGHERLGGGPHLSPLRRQREVLRRVVRILWSSAISRWEQVDVTSLVEDVIGDASRGVDRTALRRGRPAHPSGPTP